jgi:adenine-specific DNA methylase
MIWVPAFLKQEQTESSDKNSIKNRSINRREILKLGTSIVAGMAAMQDLNADERSRTSTPIREQAPEACASANSATSAAFSVLKVPSQTGKKIILANSYERSRIFRNTHLSSLWRHLRRIFIEQMCVNS